MKGSYAIVITALFFILVSIFLFNYVNSTSAISLVGGNEMLGYVGTMMIKNYYIILEIMAILLFVSLIGAFYISGKEE